MKLAELPSEFLEQRNKDIQEMIEKEKDILYGRRNKVPHDVNGKLIEVGDIVNVPCKVESVQTGEEYCNVMVKTIHNMPPYQNGTSISLNTRQVEKKD